MTTLYSKETVEKFGGSGLWPVKSEIQKRTKLKPCVPIYCHNVGAEHIERKSYDGGKRCLVCGYYL